VKRSPLAVLFLTVFVDLLGFGIVIPILPTYAVTFGASAQLVTLLGAVYSATQLLFAPLWGRLSDRVGRRPIIVLSALGSAGAYLCFGLAESLALLFVARAVGGACGANISAAQAYIADVTGPEDRARGMSIIGAGFGLGFTFGPALGGLGAHALGASAPFFIAAGLALANAVWAFLALPEPVRHRAAPPRSLSSFGDAFRLPRLAVFLVVFFVVVFAFSIMEQTFVLYTHARFGLGELENGLVFTFIGLVLSLTQAFATRRLVARFGELRLVVAGTAFMALGIGMIPLAGGLAALLAATLFLAFGNALNSPSLMATISKAAPGTRQGEMLGVAQSIGALGRIAGPAAGGALFEATRGHRLPYVVAAALMALASVFVGARLSARE
jgi:MFS family permease